MDKRDHKTDLNSAKALRKEAERRYRQKLTDLSHLDQSDHAKLMQELQIHQIELEMQNEELRDSQLQLEAIHQQYLDLYNDAPVGYASLDDSGMVLRCNRTLIELLGTEDQIMQGHALVEFMLEADQPIFRSRFRAFSHKPENKHIDNAMKLIGGKWHTYPTGFGYQLMKPL
jgi:PAS domain-containing protein